MIQPNKIELAGDKVPLIVNLNGTLLKGDLLFECIIAFIKNSPFSIFILIRWALCGITTLKTRLAEYAPVTVELLPYNEELLKTLKNEKKNGRKIVLATASYIGLAKKIAQNLDVFENVFASDDHTNLKGKEKLKILLGLYGEKGFDYIGKASRDLQVLQHARYVHLVNSSKATIKKVKKTADVVTLTNRNFSIFTLFRAVRVHQWSKNLLLMIPLIISHTSLNLRAITLMLTGFLGFSLCASATYIMNDLMDIQSDRTHPTKKYRPIASGEILIPDCLLIAASLLSTGLFLSMSIKPYFIYYVITYILFTLLYSKLFKKHVMVDVLSLAGLYTLRIFAGAQIIGVHVSFWLFAFSIFLFFGLALVKRCAELLLIQKSGKTELDGRGYSCLDINTLRSMGISSCYLAIIIFALYLNSADVLVLYSNPQYLWGIFPALLLWVNRLWIKTGRGEMHDDPIVFTLKDKTSLILSLFIIITVFLAQNV